MKQVNLRIYRTILPILLGLFLSVGAYAQQITIKGHVKDAQGVAVIGANVVEKSNTTNGTITDLDGNFVLKVPKGAMLTISFIGYKTVDVAATPSVIVTLQDDSQLLDAVVVIGYGTVKKNDLTGSVTAIKPDELNRGLTTNAQDMMSGKIAGVSVISNGGTPGGGATIRIRGGSSLNASNNPLIVIDGLAMDNDGIKGLANPLSMVNPNDIESFTVLKDASATAIYGSRASNGVIIITTKKGAKGGKTKVSYDGNMSLSNVKKTLDVLDANEYRSLVEEMYGTDSDAYRALGASNTDWQDEIYRTALSTDHNVTVSGALKDLPYRISLGYTNQNGIIKTSNFERYTASVSLTPTFLDNHLSVNANLKGMYAKNRYADGGVVGAAATFDPTQSVYNNDPDYVTSFGGYFQWTGKNEFGDSTWPLNYNSLAQANPVSTLKLKNDHATSKALIGNLELDYKFHFLPDLHAHVNGGMDLSTGKQNTDVSPQSAGNNYYGYYKYDNTDKYNLSLNAYLQYSKDFKIQHFDVMGGYEWQHFHQKGDWYSYGLYPSTHPDKAGEQYNLQGKEWAGESYLVSFFGRANYSLMNKYLLTATLRYDGSSRFNKDNRWGLFPAFAFAWKMKEESFLKNVDWLSELKLRLGYGKTGQQDGIGNYTYFASYVANQAGAYYPIGDTTGETMRPNAYNSDLTWETTTTYNAGFDFGLLNGRITGAVDYYYRETKDLLNNVAVAAGSNFKNVVTSNVGSLRNSGIEFSVAGKAIQQRDFSWDLGFNLTYNKNKLTKLTTGSGKGYYIETGGISAGTGYNAQAQAVGHPMNSFFVYQQVYGADGKPMENTFVDRNGDGIINASDRYFYKKPTADVLMGLTSKMIWKSWDFSFSLRASLNNYVYNDVESNNINMNKGAVYAQSGYLSNKPRMIINNGFNWQGQGNYNLSDYFVQNASFLKCDNITLGYSFQKLFGRNIGGRVYATVQNVFTITKYKGLDPEITTISDGKAVSGIDKDMYPRPMVSILGLSLNF